MCTSRLQYRRRLIEKIGVAIAAGGGDDNLINLEGVQGAFSCMADSVEPLDDILPTSPAPADEEHSLGSSDEHGDSNVEGD